MNPSCETVISVEQNSGAEFDAAVMAGDCDKVEKCLNSGMPADVIDSKDLTALMKVAHFSMYICISTFF